MTTHARLQHLTLAPIWFDGEPGDYDFALAFDGPAGQHDATAIMLRPAPDMAPEYLTYERRMKDAITVALRVDAQLQPYAEQVANSSMEPWQHAHAMRAAAHTILRGVRAALADEAEWPDAPDEAETFGRGRV